MGGNLRKLQRSLCRSTRARHVEALNEQNVGEMPRKACGALGLPASLSALVRNGPSKSSCAADDMIMMIATVHSCPSLFSWSIGRSCQCVKVWYQIYYVSNFCSIMLVSSSNRLSTSVRYSSVLLSRAFPGGTSSVNEGAYRGKAA